MKNRFRSFLPLPFGSMQTSFIWFNVNIHRQLCVTFFFLPFFSSGAVNYSTADHTSIIIRRCQSPSIFLFVPHVLSIVCFQSDLPSCGHYCQYWRIKCKAKNDYFSLFCCMLSNVYWSSWFLLCFFPMCQRIFRIWSPNITPSELALRHICIT